VGRFLPDLPAANCASGNNCTCQQLKIIISGGWTFFFVGEILVYLYLSPSQQACMKERAEVLREDVRKILMGPCELPETLGLILTLQRLALDYYYENEIDKLLHCIYDDDDSDYDDKDLNLVSLRFYLLRKNGYDVSSGKRSIFIKLIYEKKLAHDLFTETQLINLQMYF
jgi:hypothetical protein